MKSISVDACLEDLIVYLRKNKDLICELNISFLDEEGKNYSPKVLQFCSDGTTITDEPVAQEITITLNYDNNVICNDKYKPATLASIERGIKDAAEGKVHNFDPDKNL